MNKKHAKFAFYVEGHNPVIAIEGYIGTDDIGFMMGDPDARNYATRDLRFDLGNLADEGYKNLKIIMDSPGGDAQAGLIMYDMLVDARAKGMTIDCEIWGNCASAATLIACACDSVAISPNSTFMVHQPYGYIMGTAAEQRSSADDLDNLAERYYKIYSSKTGLTVANIRKKLAAGDWKMTAEEAVANGFVDKLLKPALACANHPLLTMLANTYPMTPGKPTPGDATIKPAPGNGTVTPTNSNNMTNDPDSTMPAASAAPAPAPAPAEEPMAVDPGKPLFDPDDPSNSQTGEALDEEDITDLPGLIKAFKALRAEMRGTRCADPQQTTCATQQPSGTCATQRSNASTVAAYGQPVNALPQPVDAAATAPAQPVMTIEKLTAIAREHGSGAAIACIRGL